MNQVNLCGRLVRDAEIRYRQGENAKAVANFTLAVDRKFKQDGQLTADFINCVAFGKVAEIIEKHVFKGTKIIAQGEWRTGSYTNKDGQKVYTNNCNVFNIEFCESKNFSANSNNANQKKNGNSGQLPPMPTGNDDFMNIPDGIEDGLPFN